MFDLGGRIALVTGGSRGIGRAISVALAGAGAHVVVGYVGNEAAAQETVATIESNGRGSAEAIRVDVASPEQTESTIEALVKRLGKLDILVNNAGVAIDQLLLRVKPAEVDKTFQTNVGGTLFASKAAIRPMMKARYGRIVNLSSVVAEAGNPGQAVYSASKAAIIGLTKTLAREYASRGVTVNCVAPGFIDTDMTAALTAEQQKGIIEQTPVGRTGKPVEIAAAVLYLVSEEAGYVTGQVIRVNGGMYV